MTDAHTTGKPPAPTLYDRRLKNILDAASFVEPEKVPVGLDYIAWPYAYAGSTLAELVHDPDAHAEAYCKFMSDIPFDYTVSAGFYEPYDAYAALGSTAFTLHKDNCTVQHNQANHKFMDFEDYDVLIRDYDYFRREYFPQKSVPALGRPREQAYEMLRQAAARISASLRTISEIYRRVTQEHQIVSLRAIRGIAPAPQYYAPIDTLFDTYRGMIDVFYDLSINTEQLDAACEKIFESGIKGKTLTPDNYSGNPIPLGYSVYHCAPFLSPEQYDKYWFKGFKSTMLPYAEKGLKIFIKGEGSFLHTIERFKEFPRGSVIIQLDSDDPKEAKKRIGDWQALCAGISTSTLVLGDKQRCIDAVKEAFDTLAPGGGFLFNQDKPLLSPGDAAPELVKEVWQFANEYSKKR